MRALLVAALAALALASAAQGATWHSVTHPSVSGQRTIFTAAEAVADDDVWAAGYAFGTVGGALEFRVMVQHWNGSSWTRANTRDRETAPAIDTIWGISAPTSSDVWIVGGSARSSSSRATTPLIEHFDGSTWRIVDLPRQGSLESLNAVAASPTGEVWVAGDKPNPQSGYYQPMVWRRSPVGVWSEIPFPAVAGCRTTADGSAYEMYPQATALRDGALYVSGWCRTTTDSSRGWLVRRAGKGWKLLVGPDSLPANSRINGLDIAPKGLVRAVGSSAPAALSLRGNSTAFTFETVPGNPPLNAVAAGAGGTAYAVGYMSLLARVGGHWKQETWPSPSGVLNGVAVEPSGTAWAVGDAFDDTGLILRRDP